MNAILQTAPADDTSPGFPGVMFGRSREGFPVALVGDNAFAMVPGKDSRHYLATGWRIARSLDEWARSDFYGHSGELADEAAFRARVEENALHQQQRAALDRREISSRAHTPWGTSQGATVHAVGVVFHSTASHGGFHLSPERNAKVHPLLRAGAAWYEEDCHWAAVAHAFPEFFTDSERASADSTIRNWYPEAWEAIHCKVMEPGQSSTEDEREFYKRHADDWIVVSAIRSDQELGFTEVVATMGGDRAGTHGTRRYLVPAEEYGTSGGRFGFIIDENRHRRYDGPSSFIGWQR
ncbi:DUF7007 domain-containing protein [Aminobacter aminovorans]|uniref:DUF7007 domain-containing protein n=1 Tax=Aminobacter aminovorans TaxID=83263 RepID=A0AAC8YVR7_AMIAI|nr:hypothetical protein [Aminobacter aminovorans]AMS45387.1 hypothetical protein AA2016_6493 [Aminobacter aminovorans]MBB3708865.1 hypothetical protein [Aminobacter aminovorans]